MTGLRRMAEQLLKIEDTPHRTALAFGIGLFIAFFPVIGIHTGMALAVAFAFRLSRLALLVGCWTNNPWTIGPMLAAGTALGCMILGTPTDDLAEIDWSLKGQAFYTHLLVHLRPYLWPYVLGNTILGLVAGAAGYLIVRTFLDRRRAGVLAAT